MARSEIDALMAALAPVLTQHGVTVVTAESCTGGALAAALTAVPGSSVWFERGFVTYSNSAKQELLGVPAAVLATHGAVSEAVAEIMAAGALAQSRASIAIAITGIAGPGGGTPTKPVGTVCFGFGRRDGHVRTETAQFAGDRGAVRRQSVAYALRRLLVDFEAAVPVRPRPQG